MAAAVLTSYGCRQITTSGRRFTMKLELQGKRALITGGSRGIGLGAAQLLAGEGCHLHLAARSAADLETAKAGILRSHAVEISCHAVDLSNAANAVALA